MQATETDTRSSVPPSVLAGRYQVEGKLGGGGASEVYRAHDLRLSRSVAVKLFRHRAGAHSDRRCGDEARLLANLNHPGLIDVYDAGWYDDREFLVLQLVEGRTLGRRIAGGPLPAEDVMRIGAVLAEALHHVHERGIVHRDVKPSNVLCADDGGVFLTDFGISHPTGAEGVDRAGVVVGTAPYLAPEQVQGGPIGPPCDVYALGLVLLECLTGKREYPGSQIEAAMARLHREPVVPEHAPAPLGRLIRSMTSLDPAARPSAGDCHALLTVDAPTVDLAAVVAEVPALGIDYGPDEEELRRVSAELPTAAVVLDLSAVESALPEPLPGVMRRRPSGAHRRRRGYRRGWNGVSAALWPALHREPAPEARAS